MPANLPPQYFEAEKRYRVARTPVDKILVLEEMLAIMPKHKGTEKLQAELRTKIARLSREMGKRHVIGRYGGFYMAKEGAATVFIMPPQKHA